MVENNASVASSPVKLECQESHVARQMAKAKMKGEPRLAEGQLTEIAPKTGKRNRYCLRNSERHLLPRCPELSRRPTRPPPLPL